MPAIQGAAASHAKLLARTVRATIGKSFVAIPRVIATLNVVRGLSASRRRVGLGFIFPICLTPANIYLKRGRQCAGIGLQASC